MVKNVQPEFAQYLQQTLPFASLSSQPITRYRSKGGSAMSARFTPKFNAEALDNEHHKSPAQYVH